MLLAEWLVANTTEHTPGPWRAVPTNTVAGEVVLVEAVNGERLWCTVASCATFPSKPLDGDERPEPWYGNESLANGRLIADAPAMLALLARALQGGANAYAKEKNVPVAARKLMDDMTALIARHVRTGCAPADAEARVPGLGIYVHLKEREEG